MSSAAVTQILQAIGAGDSHAANDLIPLNVRQDHIKEDNVIFIMPGEFDRLLSGLGMFNDRAGTFQHQRHTVCRRQIIFDQ